MIGFNQTNSFEICVMDLMEELKEKIKTAEDVEQFSMELHESIETAIGDMLDGGEFNGINIDDYNPQY
jgi:hypothetical protein